MSKCLFLSWVVVLDPNKSLWTRQSNEVVVCLHIERKRLQNKETMIYNQSVGQEYDNTNHLFVDVSIDKSITRLYFSPSLANPNLFFRSNKLLKFRIGLAISFHYSSSNHKMCLKSQVEKSVRQVE